MITINELRNIYKSVKEKSAPVDKVKEIAEIYRGIFHKSITSCGCKTAVEDGILEMINYIKNMDKLFQLKPGAILLYPANDVNNCNWKTIDDEKALFHLRMYPEKIKLFSRYPENWKDLLVTGIKKTTEFDDLPLKEIKKRLIDIAYVNEDFVGKNKEELIQMLIEG